MNSKLPLASDSAETLADWLELEALRSADKSASLETLVQTLRRGGSVDAIEKDDDDDDTRTDRGSEKSQQVAADAFLELAGRANASAGQYPFEVEQGLIRVPDVAQTSPYVALLMMSVIAPTTGHNGTAALFEHLCTHAAHTFLGGKANDAGALRFGAPRKKPHTKFRDAIDHLCVQLAEGDGCKVATETHTGDNGLDIVAWRGFTDRKPGKLVAFGQCAGGTTDWDSKLNELDGTKFAKKWFRAPLAVDPLRLFFVPRRVPKDDWFNTAVDGGILFDRCRIAACLKGLDASLVQECTAIVNKISKKALAL